MRVQCLLFFFGVSSAGCFSMHNKVGAPPATMPVEAAQDIVRRAIESDTSYLSKNGEFHQCCARKSDVHFRTYGGSFVESLPDGTHKLVRLPLDKPIEEFEQYRATFGLCLGPFARLGGYKGDMLHGCVTSAGFYTRKPADVRRTAQAHNVLVAWKHEHGDAEFARLAEQWRAVNPAPKLSEEGEKHRILAENAFREKNPEKAAEHFEAALDTDPTWPAGNFNLALLYGEAKDYKLASFFMKRYLLLAPDSVDAKAAKEKVVIWDDKADHPALR